MPFEEGQKAIVSGVANFAKQGEVGGRLLELKVVIGWMCLEMEVGEDLELNRSHDLEMVVVKGARSEVQPV